MAEWQPVPLASIVTFTRDGEWGTGEPGADRTEMAVIRGTDFPRVRVGDLSTLPRRHIAASAAERKTLCAGDILIETAGGTKDQATGRTVLVTERLLRSIGAPTTCASFARFLRLDRTRVDPAFLYWWLQGLYSAGEMEKHQVQHTGVARFQFTRFLDSTAVPLPEMHEQVAIARVLSALDDRIGLSRRMNETLEAMARALFKSWFVDFDPVRAKAEGRAPAGMDAATAALFPSRLVETAEGEVPEGWTLGTVADFAGNLRVTAAPSAVEATTPYVGLEHVGRGRLFLDEIGVARGLESQKTRFREGDVLFGKLRPYFKKVALAPTDGVCSTDILVLSPVEGSRAFTLLLAASDPFIEHAVSLSDGTRMPRTSWEQLCRYPVPVPPTPLRVAFDRVCAPFFDRCLANRREAASLAAVRDALLPRLLSGELRPDAAEPEAAPIEAAHALKRFVVSADPR